MAEHQTPKRNEELFTPHAPKNHHVSRPEYQLLSPANFSKALPSTPEKDVDDHGDLKSLVNSSEPDFRHLSFPYLGPPIGYSAKITTHSTTALGVPTASISGTLLAPRPRLSTQCDDHLCSTCQPTLVDAALSFSSTTPTPLTPNALEYVSPRSSPPLDVQKMLREFEVGVEVHRPRLRSVVVVRGGRGAGEEAVGWDDSRKSACHR